MRLRRMTAGLVLGVLLSVAGTAAAEAATPVDTGGSSVVDQVHALTSAQVPQVTDAVDRVASDSSTHLTVVYVDTFSDPANDQAWAIASAQRSGLGSGDLLVAVATQSHQYGFARSNDYPLSHAEVQSLVDSALIPDLKQHQWADAAISFSKALDTRLQGGGSGSAGSSGSGSDPGQSASSSGTSGGSVFLTLFLLVALVAVVLVVVRVLRRRRAVTVGAGAGPSPVGPPAAPPVDQKELDTQAARALIALDDELTTSDQELGFAEAEFGEEAAKPFRAALETAKAKAKEAFGIRQQLDDEIPETPDQRRAMTQRIIQLAKEADAGLDAQKESFDSLRKLEAQLPDAVRAADGDRARLAAQADAAESALTQLRSRYGDDATRGSADDLTQARSLLAFAQQALMRAGAAGGKAGEGAVALRGAQQALGQAGTLLAGISAAPGEFEAAKRRLDATVADTRSDADEARRLLPRAGGDRQALERAVKDADAAVAAAAGTAPNAALPPLEQANAALNDVLDRVRSRADSTKRAVTALPRVLDGAERSVEATRRYIDTRRGGVGTDARTRIVEAQRQLDTATAAQHDDPVGALAAAQRAQSLANEAYELAQQDVDDFRGGPWGGGGRYGGGGGGFLTGALLGGILGGALGGDRWGGGGWGGDGWGGGGGWGGDVGGGDFGGGGGFDGGGGGFGGGDSGGGGGF